MFKGFGGSKKKSVLEDNELTTGIVQHPVTGLWQTWISFTGNDIQLQRPNSPQVTWSFVVGTLSVNFELVRFVFHWH
ncbi:MAG: hypothetical protein V7L17_23980, partial [Nostoc sp.]